MILRKLHKDNRGATAVEMALVLPMFFLFVFGIVEMGRAYWTLHTMQMAVDEAGRYVMINDTASDSQIISRVQSHLYGFNSGSFTITPSSSSASGISYKTIAISYTYSFLVPNLLPFGNLNLTRQTTVPLIP